MLLRAILHSVSRENDLNKEYIGANRAKIKGIYGIPDRVVNDKDMGEILVYEKFTSGTNSYATANSYNKYGVSAYGNTTSYTNRDYIEFYFNQDRCYKVKTNQTKYVRELNKGKTAACFITTVLIPIAALIALIATH